MTKSYSNSIHLSVLAMLSYCSKRPKRPLLSSLCLSLAIYPLRASVRDDSRPLSSHCRASASQNGLLRVLRIRSPRTLAPDSADIFLRPNLWEMDECLVMIGARCSELPV